MFVGRLIGRLFVGRLIGRLFVGRLIVGRLFVGRLIVGRLFVGRRVLGRRLIDGRHGFVSRRRFNGLRIEHRLVSGLLRFAFDVGRSRVGRGTTRLGLCLFLFASLLALAAALFGSGFLRLLRFDLRLFDDVVHLVHGELAYLQ